MKVKVNIREVVEDNASTYDSIPEEIDVDIHELLAEHRQIAHLWGVDDVRALRPDLNADQAWRVLQTALERLDCNVGITCDTVETIADELYGGKPKLRWQGRIDLSVEHYSRDEAIEHFTDLAAHIEKDAVNSTTKASFDAASLRLVEPNETGSK